MSNKKITDLTELTNPTTDDVFPIVDIATNTTQKVQVGNLPIQTAVTTALATKQATLVSGTNIKTVNGNSVLGSGDINIPLTPPSGVSGAIQFSTGSAFASDASNLFWDDTNNRLGVGTNAPTVSIQSLGTIQGANLTATANANFGNVLYGPNFWSQANGDTYLGAQTPPSAKLQIKGNGSTSATTSLLVQNSSGSAALQVFDNGQIYMQQAGGASLFLDRIKAFTAADISMPLFLVGVGTLSASAAVQINATDRGFLPPRMTTTQKNAIGTPAAGLVVYDSTTNKLCCYNGSTWNDLF